MLRLERLVGACWYSRRNFVLSASFLVDCKHAQAVLGPLPSLHHPFLEVYPCLKNVVAWQAGEDEPEVNMNHWSSSAGGEEPEAVLYYTFAVRDRLGAVGCLN